MSDTKTLTKLGSKKTEYPTAPSIDILETFENQNPKSLYAVPFVCTEFTSLCPKTGQPDFARFEIVYIPNKNMVESKSLKLYLFSFRNSGEFHEDVTNRIFNDLWKKMTPKYMRIFGDFTVRGGIAIKPLVEKFDSNLTPKQVKQVERIISQWDSVKTHIKEI